MVSLGYKYVVGDEDGEYYFNVNYASYQAYDHFVETEVVN